MKLQKRRRTDSTYDWREDGEQVTNDIFKYRWRFSFTKLPLTKNNGDYQMPKETNNVPLEALAAMFSAFNRHDGPSVTSFMTDDVVFEGIGGSEVCGSRIAGKAAVQATFEQTWTDMPDVQWADAFHYQAGDRFISEWIFRATRPDGKRIEVEGIDVFTFRDERICLKRAFRKDRPAF